MDKRHEEVAQMLRESLIPAAGVAPAVNIDKLYVIVTGDTAVEILTALRQTLKDPRQ